MLSPLGCTTPFRRASVVISLGYISTRGNTLACPMVCALFCQAWDAPGLGGVMVCIWGVTSFE